MSHNLCLLQKPFCIYKHSKNHTYISPKQKQKKFKNHIMFDQDSFFEHKSMHEALDELDETLSLCDLPLYGDQSVEEWGEDLSLESQGSTSISSSEEHDDYFEFFSNELARPAVHFPQEDIVFCGKIIPYRKPDSSGSVPSKEVEIERPSIVEKKPVWSLFKWRFASSTKGSKASDKGTTAPMQEKDRRRRTSEKRYNTNKQGKGYDSTLHKVSVLTSSSSGKAKWFLFLTGISRFSSKIEVRDIKNRQSRRHCPSMAPSPAEAEDLSRSSSSGLWEVVRVLSCGGNHSPDSMVVASICNRGEGR